MCVHPIFGGCDIVHAFHLLRLGACVRLCPIINSVRPHADTTSSWSLLKSARQTTQSAYATSTLSRMLHTEHTRIVRPHPVHVKYCRRPEWRTHNAEATGDNFLMLASPLTRPEQTRDRVRVSECVHIPIARVLHRTQT